jgi:hypothetical protein
MKDEIHLLRLKLLIEMMRVCKGGIIIQNYRLPNEGRSPDDKKLLRS